jgi:hypothetical protein
LNSIYKTEECLDSWLTWGLSARVVRGKLFRCPHCARAAEAKEQAAEKQQQQQQQNRIASPTGKQPPGASSPKRHGIGAQHHTNKQQPSKSGNPAGAAASSAAAAASSAKIGEKSCRLCKGTGSVRPEAMRNIKVRWWWWWWWWLFHQNEMKWNEIKYNQEDRQEWSLLIDGAFIAVFPQILPSLPNTTFFRLDWAGEIRPASSTNVCDSDSDVFQAPPSNGVTVATVTDKGVLNVVLDQKRAPTQHR